MESSILTITYLYSFFSDLQIVQAWTQIEHLMLDHLRFKNSVNIGGYLVVEDVKRSISSLSFICKLHKSAL